MFDQIFLRSALKRFLMKNCPNCHVCLHFVKWTIKIYLRILRSLFPLRLRKHPHFYHILLFFLSSFAKISPFQNFAIVKLFQRDESTNLGFPRHGFGRTVSSTHLISPLLSHGVLYRGTLRKSHYATYHRNTREPGTCVRLLERDRDR